MTTATIKQRLKVPPVLTLGILSGIVCFCFFWASYHLSMILARALSSERGPLEFTLGQGKLIPGFEEAVVGMETGESKTIKIPADQAYGPHREEMVLEVNRAEIPTSLNPVVGQQLQIRQPNGQSIPVMVTETTDKSVTIDANHPLAGEDLTFDLQLIEIA